MAEATEKRWGVWLATGDRKGSGWCCDSERRLFETHPVTYQEALAAKERLEKWNPKCSYEVREVPLQSSVGDAYDSSTHAADCMCENVCLEEKERAYGVWLASAEPDWVCVEPGAFPIRPVTLKEAQRCRAERIETHPELRYEVRRMGTKPVGCGVCFTTSHDEESCKSRVETAVGGSYSLCFCGKMTLNSWMKSVTDAGNENTDYVKHTRESCLTREARRAQNRPQIPLRPSSPSNFGLDPLGYLCAASQEALAKALFFSERCIIRHVCEMADYGSGVGTVGPFEVPLAPEILKTLEKAWRIGSSAPEDSFTIEALMYRGACETARNIFLLAEGLKAAGLKQI